MTAANHAHRAPPVPEMQAAILERKLAELEARMGEVLERLDPEVRQGATPADESRPRLPPEPPPSAAVLACESGAAAAGPQLMLQVESRYAACLEDIQWRTSQLVPHLAFIEQTLKGRVGKLAAQLAHVEGALKSNAVLDLVQRQLAVAQKEVERLRQENEVSDRSGRALKLRCSRAEEGP